MYLLKGRKGRAACAALCAGRAGRDTLCAALYAGGCGGYNRATLEVL